METISIELAADEAAEGLRQTAVSAFAFDERFKPAAKAAAQQRQPCWRGWLLAGLGITGSAPSSRATWLICALILLQAPASFGRSVEFLRDFCVGAHGGLEDLDYYDVGLQALTVDGPGDSSLLMYHLGFGLDLDYARLGEGAHHLRILPTCEATLWFLFLQAGVGPSIDLKDTRNTGTDVALNFGLRLFLGDEYQNPSISVGGRLDWLIGERDAFVTSAFVRFSFWFRAPGR